MYRVRVRVPGGVWSRWANWHTTPIVELAYESSGEWIDPEMIGRRA